jgi:hypothetical protein
METQNVLSAVQCQTRKRESTTRTCTLRSRSPPSRKCTLRSRSPHVTGAGHHQRLRRDPTRHGVHVGHASSSSGGHGITAVTRKSQPGRSALPTRPGVRVGLASSSSGGHGITAVTRKSQPRWSDVESDDDPPDCAEGPAWELLKATLAEGEARQEDEAASQKFEKSEVRQYQTVAQSRKVWFGEETLDKPAPAQKPSFAEFVRFVKNVRCAAETVQDTWPERVEQIAEALPEMVFPEMNAWHADFRLGVCICSLNCVDQLKLTLPLLLFNLMPQAGIARVYLLISESDEDTIHWLLEAMTAPLHMRLLMVCMVKEATWHYAEWHNFIIDFAAKDGATVVNLFNLLNHSMQ